MCLMSKLTAIIKYRSGNTEAIANSSNQWDTVLRKADFSSNFSYMVLTMV